MSWINHWNYELDECSLYRKKNRMAKQKNISWKKFECLWTNFERTLNELWTNFERTFQAISKQSYFCFISFISLTRKTGLDISYLVGTRDGFSLSFPWDWICFVFFTEFLSFLTTRLNCLRVIFVLKNICSTK